MGIFDRFQKVERSMFPVLYYREESPQGSFVKEEEFSLDFAKAIVLFCKRLHAMGVLPEDRIVSFSIPSILEILEKWKLVSGVKIQEFNAIQVAFGDNYAGFWYEDKDSEKPEQYYLFPEQIAIYHTKKASNYYLSILQGGLDLCENQVEITNQDKPFPKIASGKSAKLSIAGRAELKTSFHLLFVYLKYSILFSKKKEEYLEFAKKLSRNFCKREERENFDDYVQQYFSLNTEKKKDYPLAHTAESFSVFLKTLAEKYQLGLELDENSFAEYTKFFLEHLGVEIEKKIYKNRFEFLMAANERCQEKGKEIYLWKSPAGLDAFVLVGEKREEFYNSFGITLVPFAKECSEDYQEEIAYEEEIRSLFQKFATLLGVAKLEKMLFQILGSEVLDHELYEKSYLMYFDWKEEDISYILYECLANYALEDLMEDFRVEEKSFEEDERSPYDRVILYAKEIQKRGKILVYLDTESDSYHFCLIDATEEAKKAFQRLAETLIEIGEIASYTLFDS